MSEEINRFNDMRIFYPLGKPNDTKIILNINLAKAFTFLLQIYTPNENIIGLTVRRQRLALKKL